MDFARIIEKTAKRSAVTMNDGDFIGENGLIYCGKCKEAREQVHIIPYLNNKKIRAIRLCKCEREQEEKEKQDFKRWEYEQKVKELTRIGITSPMYQRYTFGKDDNRQPKATAFCRNYVDKWETMKENAAGAIFYGEVGKGKTFLAGCIGDELIKKGVRVLFTSLKSLVNNRIKSNNGKAEQINLDRFQCFVLDDIGIENASSTAYEIIDEIYRLNVPVIITTNLSPDELKNPDTTEKKRIYDRILQQSATNFCLIDNNKSRLEIAQQKRKYI